MDRQTKSVIRFLTDGVLLIPLLLVLATVFIINRELANGIVSGKYFWFYAGMGLVAISTFLSAIISKKRFRFSISDSCILFFAGSIFFSTFILNDAPLNTTRLTLAFSLLILYFSIRIIIYSYAKKTFNQTLLCFFILVTAFVEAVWGLRQLYGFETSQHSLFKVTGSFFNPGPYSGYLAMVFPLALYYFLNPILFPGNRFENYLSLFVKWFSGLTCVAIFLVLPAAMSRASWLGVIGGSFIVLLAYGVKHYPVKAYYLRHKKRIHLLVFILSVLSFAALSGMYLMKKDSADGRTLMWKVSWQAIQKHPFGVGLGNFSGVYGDAQAEYMLSGKASETEEYVAGNPEYAFNEYFQIGVESGITGLFLFIGILVFSFRSLFRSKQWGIMGALTALLIFACFSYPFSVLPYLIVFVVFLAMDNEPTTTKRNRWISPAIAFLCLLLTSFVLYKQYPVYKAYKKWKQEQLYYSVGLYKDVSKSYSALYPYLNDQIKFLFEYAQSLSKSEQYAESNRILARAMQISCDPVLYNIAGKNYQALKEYEQAEYYLIRSTQIVPNRLYPYYLLTKLYDEMGEKEKALKTAQIVLTKEPKVDSMAVKEMREEIVQIMNKINEI